MAFDFKSIKSLFVIEEAASETNKSKVANQANESSKPADPQQVLVKESKEGEPGKVTSKFTDILFSALEKNNLSGVDYLEYRQSLQSLEKMPMEEKVRYQSAFAMAQAMGATPQKLIETASHYLDVLKGEEAKFNEALAKQEASKVEGGKRKIDQLEAAVKQKEEQIKRLTAEVEQHRKEMESKKKEIGQAINKMETTKNNFIASYNSLVSLILKDVENMKKFLK